MSNGGGGKMKNHFFLGQTGWFVCAIFIFTFLSLSVFGADITLEPNGVISHGTTLTVRINVSGGVKAVDLEIVWDENGNGKGDSHEKRLLAKTTVTDGGRTGKLRDHSITAGEIEIHLRVASDVKPGQYVIRFTPGTGRLYEGAVLEIVQRSGDFFFWLNEYIRDFKERINDPAYVLHMVKSGDRDRVKMADLWLMNAGTYEIAGRLTDTGDCLNPCWSPDGKRLVYVRWINDAGQLWILAVDGGKVVSKPVRVPVDVPGSILDPVWSHSGEKIAFLSGDGLWLTDAGGTKTVKVTAMQGMREILAWSRDDRWLIFAAKPAADMPALAQQGGLQYLHNVTIKPEDRGILDIWKVDTRTGKPERLIYDVFWQWMSYVSPAGSRLVFPVKTTAAAYELWLRQGKNFKDAQRLTGGNYMDIEPAWSSDGKWIVFVSNRDK